MIPFVVDLLRSNDLFYGEYAEPFAGGAGIAISLLVDGYVSRVYLNDIDPAIHSFWDAALNHTDALCGKIESTAVTIDEWFKQRDLYRSPEGVDVVSRGFSTLFLNRTNRSGIIKAGVIGGMGQSGAYKLDCRFMKPDLVQKIKRIAAVKEHISLTNLDAVQFVSEVIPMTSPRTLVNLDPPYFGKGPELYTNFYKAADHARLASVVSTIQRRWMVTYDDATEIRKLYSKYPTFTSDLNYSAQEKRVGTELMVFDKKMVLPKSLDRFRIQSLRK